MTPGPHNCVGCTSFEDYDGAMMCTNAIHWHGGTPPQPECFQYAPEFLDAVDNYDRLVETLGDEHPEANNALLLVMETAPAALKNEMTAKARELGLIPDVIGFLDNGSPVFNLEDVAKRLGFSMAEAEEILAERGALDPSNADVAVDPMLVHPVQ